MKAKTKRADEKNPLGSGKKRKSIKKQSPKKKAVQEKAVKRKAAQKKTAAKKTAGLKKKPAAKRKSASAGAGKRRLVKGKAAKKTTKITQVVLAPDYRPSRREKYMCAEQLAYFNKRLLEWKEILMLGVDKTVDHLKHEVNNYADTIDRAAHEEEFDLELRTRDRERKLIKKINRALALIDNRKYGYCTECSAKIGLKRIEARPTATLCIDCKTVQEIHEKQIAEDA